MTTAGPRKTAPVRYLPSRPGSAEVAGAEAARLRPRLSCRSGREELDERLDRRRVTERDEQVARDLDAVCAGPGVDGREREDVEPGSGLRLRRGQDHAADEVGLEHH